MMVFLKIMWNVLWTTFRHPFTTTYIDPETGKVIQGNGPVLSLGRIIKRSRNCSQQGRFSG